MHSRESLWFNKTRSQNKCKAIFCNFEHNFDISYLLDTAFVFQYKNINIKCLKRKSYQSFNFERKSNLLSSQETAIYYKMVAYIILFLTSNKPLHKNNNNFFSDLTFGWFPNFSKYVNYLSENIVFVLLP